VQGFKEPGSERFQSFRVSQSQVPKEPGFRGSKVSRFDGKISRPGWEFKGTRQRAFAVEIFGSMGLRNPDP
jgi:hypothetical protein